MKKTVFITALIFPIFAYANDMFDSAMLTGITGVSSSAVNTKEAIDQGAKCIASPGFSCVLATAHTSQALLSGKQALSSFKTADRIKPDGYEMPDYAQELLDQNNYSNPTLQQTQSQLKNLGYSVEQNGKIKTPKGKTIDINDLKNKDKFTSAGFTPQEFNKLQTEMNKIEKKINTNFKKKYNEALKKHQAASSAINNNFPNQNSYGYNHSDLDYKMPDFSSFFNQPIQPKKEDIKGLSVMHGKEKIGVSGDNIFDMVKRQYNERSLAMKPGTKMSAKKSRWWIDNK